MRISFAAARFVITLLMLFGTDAAGAAEQLAGRYYGVEDAAGASIEIQPDEDGFRGTFFDAKGKSQAFEADRTGAVAEAVLDMDGRTVLMRMFPLPYGAQVSIVPFDKTGRLVVQAGRELTFVRAGLKLPRPGPDFAEPPKDSSRRITANAFLASYEFWRPKGVRDGYLSLPQRSRTMIRLFPAVQLDIIWKLCLAPAPEAALALALRGQGVACREVLEGIAATQRSGSFVKYKAEVAQQRDTLRISVRCAEGYPETRETCDRASRTLSRQAVSLDTAATVLARYR
jgi:hypothetical protein